jgi:hypothetical protein
MQIVTYMLNTALLTSERLTVLCIVADMTDETVLVVGKPLNTFTLRDVGGLGLQRHFLPRSAASYCVMTRRIRSAVSPMPRRALWRRRQRRTAPHQAQADRPSIDRVEDRRIRSVGREQGARGHNEKAHLPAKHSAGIVRNKNGADSNRQLGRCAKFSELVKPLRPL